jgi:hypothetical protein
MIEKEVKHTALPWVKATDRLPMHMLFHHIKVNDAKYTAYYDYSVKKFLLNVGDRGFRVEDVVWLDDEQLDSLKSQLSSLQAFKDYVHKRLDNIWTNSQSKRIEELTVENERLKAGPFITPTAAESLKRTANERQDKIYSLESEVSRLTGEVERLKTENGDQVGIISYLESELTKFRETLPLLNKCDKTLGFLIQIIQLMKISDESTVSNLVNEAYTELVKDGTLSLARAQIKDTISALSNSSTTKE